MTTRSETALNLVVLRARDPDQLCDFYTALGLCFVREQHGDGHVHHACEIGQSVFEIYPRNQDEPTTTGTRIGFSVPSLDTVLKTLAIQNRRVLSGPVRTPTGRRAVVCDPEGHKVELIEPARMQSQGCPVRGGGYMRDDRAAPDG